MSSDDILDTPLPRTGRPRAVAILRRAIALLRRDGWQQGAFGPSTPKVRAPRCAVGALMAADRERAVAKLEAEA
jgi:hypothetical protein